MEVVDLITLLIGLPCAAIIGGVAGRMCQRRCWKLHLPYEARVAALRRAT